MYLQCKQGFVEVDAWDEQVIPVPQHQRLVRACVKRSSVGKVAVIRSREEITIKALLKEHGVRAKVLASPPGWDYQYRAYIPLELWARIMEGVAMGLDYRNFKTWCSNNTPKRYKLASDIWHAAHAAGEVKSTVIRHSDFIYDGARNLMVTK